MARAKVILNLETERNKLVNRHNSKKWTNVDYVEKYQKTINEKFTGTDTLNLEDLNNNIVKAINTAQKKHCLKQGENEDKLSTNTKNLIKQIRILLGKRPKSRDRLR